MARGVTNDLLGLATSAATICMEYAENATIQEVTGPNKRGDIVASDYYGAQSTPSNTYSLKGDVDIAANIVPGELITDGSDKFIVTGAALTTSNGAAPTLTVNYASVDASATQGEQYTLPACTLGVEHESQILFGAFELSGSDCHVLDCSATISSTLTRSPDAEGVYTTIHGVMIDVTATIDAYGATAPTVTPAEDWNIVNPLTQGEGDKSYQTYSVTLRKYLTSNTTTTTTA